MKLFDILNKYKKTYEYINSSKQLDIVLKGYEKKGWKCIKIIGTNKPNEYWFILEEIL